MAEDGLLIPIRFTLEEASAALNELESRARAAGQRAGDGVSLGMNKGLSGMKENMGRARETAMFFTQALGEFGPAGRTAQMALSSLGSIMLGGGVLGAGLMAAQVGVRLLTDAWEEEARAAKDAAAQATAAAAARAAANRELMSQANGSIVSLRGIEASLKDQTAAEKAHQEVQKINVQLQLAQEPAYRRTLEARLREAQAIEATVVRLEGEKNAREAAAKAAEQAAKAAADRAALAAAAGAQAWQWEVDYANRKTALLAEAEKVGLDQRQLIELDYQRTMAGLRDADTESQVAALAIRNARLAALEAAGLDERRALVAEFRAEILAGQAEALAELEKLKAEIEGSLGMGAVRSFAGSFTASMSPVLNSSRAYSKAMKAQGVDTKDSLDLSAAAFAAWTQGALANMALQATTESLMAVARGIAYASTPGLQGFSAGQFAAAAKFGMVAGVAGAAALTIGATRGMTAAERASVEDQRQRMEDQRQQGADDLTGGKNFGGAREFGSVGGTTGGGTVTVRETIYIGVVANDFESPAETARRAARVMQLAERLDLVRRDAA